VPAPAPIPAAPPRRVAADGGVLADHAAAGAAPAAGPAADHRRARRGVAAAALALLGVAFVLAAAVRDAPPDGPGRRSDPAPAATRSATAWSLYLAGRQAAGAFDGAAAYRLFNAARAADPHFALATASAAAVAPDESTEFALYARADSLAARAAARDRLLVSTMVGAVTMDAGRLAASDTLAARFPGDVDAMVARANLLMRAGRYDAIIAELTPLVRGAAARPESGGVALNDLYAALFEAHLSLAAFADAERVARVWAARLPALPGPWERLAQALAARGRCAAADLAVDSAAARTAHVFRARPAFDLACEGEYARAAAWFDGYRALRDPSEWPESLWWQVIAERYAGQLEAAERHARALAEAPGAPAQHLLHHAQIVLERGRPREAAAKFALAAERIALQTHERLPARLDATGRAAHGRAWGLTHVATALAAAGELDAASALADTVGALARLHVAARGRLLPHYVRGVVLAGRAERAADASEAAALRGRAIAELRQALDRPFRGVAAARLALGRLLTAEGRAAEAVAVLRPGAWRGLEDGNLLYATAPDYRLALAEAYDLAGERDSAAAEYRRVQAAWRAADPAFLARRAFVGRRLAALDGRRREPRPAAVAAAPGRPGRGGPGRPATR
jgi:hypothetical protein